MCNLDVHTRCNFGWGMGWGLAAVGIYIFISFALWTVLKTLAGFSATFTAMIPFLLTGITIFTIFAWGYNPMCAFDPARTSFVAMIVPPIAAWPLLPECALTDAANTWNYFVRPSYDWITGLSTTTATSCPNALNIPSPADMGYPTYWDTFVMAWKWIWGLDGAPSTLQQRLYFFWLLPTWLWLLPALALAIVILIWFYRDILLLWWNALLSVFWALVNLISLPGAILVIVFLALAIVGTTFGLALASVM